jgi:hypothetical protein
MTATELENAIRRKLEGLGLLRFVWQERSQFLDVPGGAFVEVVLRDGAKIKEVLDAVSEVKSEKNVDFELIVRAAWELYGVEDPGIAYSPQGTPRFAIEFPVVLKAGEAKLPIAVAVTYLAQQHLKQIGRGDTQTLKQIVKDYVRLKLSLGGASYWDPVAYPYLEINDAAVSYLMSRGVVSATKDKAVI